MSFAIITGGVVTKYPATVAADAPGSSVAVGWNGGTLEGKVFVPVAATTPPSFNYATQNLVEVTPALISSTWTQQWSVVAASADEISARAAAVTAAAQEAKAAAAAGVDNGDNVAGDKIERLARAVAMVALDAANAERTCLTAMNTAVQGAATLAALKTAFAAISYPPQVTAAQLVSAIKAKIAASAET